jgi:DNA-binding MarR family transcriptional regulator
MSVNLSDRRAAPKTSLATPNPLFLRDDELLRGIELLEAAHRALLADGDRRLAGLGLGRSHQRLLHGIARQPGITMARLQAVVASTKQNLSRLLKELEAQELVERRTDPRDRRQRPLELTARGRELEEHLQGRLRRRLAAAYRAAGAEAVAGHHRVLLGLLDERTRRRLPGGG